MFCWFPKYAPSRVGWNWNCYYGGVESISVQFLERGEQAPDGKVNVQVSSSTQNLARLIPRCLMLILRLGVGICLSWLLADFNRTLAPDKSTLPPWLVLAMFLGASPFIARRQWRAWRMSAPSASPVTKLQDHLDERAAHSASVPGRDWGRPGSAPGTGCRRFSLE